MPSPAPDDLLAELRLQESAWERNDVLRELYRGWYREIARRCADVGAPTIELGSGIGKLQEALAEAVVTDVVPTPWADAAVDAQRLPYDDAALGNLVLVDVLHHVPDPALFFDEASRCLVPGGRIVLLEPYCSLVSYPVYRLFHHERTDLSADAFAAGSSDDPLDANQALPTLIFFRKRQRFAAAWPALRVVERRRLALLAYPLAGGWRRRPLLPLRLLPLARHLETVLAPLAPLLAFRCLVVVQKVSPGAD